MLLPQLQKSQCLFLSNKLKKQTATKKNNQQKNPTKPNTNPVGSLDGGGLFLINLIYEAPEMTSSLWLCNTFKTFLCTLLARSLLVKYC